MIYDSISSFCGSLEPMRPLMGIDVGTKTLGLATSDILLTTAGALLTVKREKFSRDAIKVLQISGSRNVGGFIIGLPINMDGSEGPKAQSIRSFAWNFSKKTSLPMAFWDERLSTVAAEKTLLEADVARKRRSEVIDALAACYILQGALDRISHLRSKP
ncbi:MAG: Holliday junction resolvase RuvX [Roseovarius sp.]|nr:Holliday junction resolvase RuvX [Roseovarius sp.]